MADCPTPSKIAHSDRASAARHLRALRAVGGSPDLNVYRCPSGEHWHVGHSAVSLRRRIRQSLRRIR